MSKCKCGGKGKNCQAKAKEVLKKLAAKNIITDNKGTVAAGVVGVASAAVLTTKYRKYRKAANTNSDLITKGEQLYKDILNSKLTDIEKSLKATRDGSKQRVDDLYKTLNIRLPRKT